MVDAFKVWDKGRDRNDFCGRTGTRVDKLSEEEVDQMVRHAEVDGEGRFNIAELNGRRLTHENILCIS